MKKDLEKLVDIYNKIKNYYESINIRKELEKDTEYLFDSLKNKLSNVDDTVKYD